MVGVGGLVVIGGMATCAGIGGIGVITSNMTSCAIIGYSSMCALNFIELVVYRECSWIPSGASGVALLAVDWDIEGFVVGVDSLIVVSGMAPRTGVGSAGIVTVVA